jgi:hypothetical protein
VEVKRAGLLAFSWVGITGRIFSQLSVEVKRAGLLAFN